MAIKEKEAKDSVALNQIWKEHVQKEREKLTLRETFTLSPKSMIIIPDKPNVAHAALKESASPEIVEKLKETLANTKKTPLEKYSAPVTTAHEIGWYKYNKPLGKTKDHSLSSCDITKYASDFSQALGHSPFARPKPAAAT